jgi:hypothetical protein
MPDYREKIRLQIEQAAAEKAAALNQLLDTASGEAARRSAAPPPDAETDRLAKALLILRDAQQDVAVRIATLEAVVPDLGTSEELLDEALALLADRAAPEALRQAALAALQIANFSSPWFPTKQPAFFDTLRALLDDATSPALQGSALEYLATQRDAYAQQRLVEGLRDPARAVVPPEVAIQLLSYDLHAGHFPLLYALAADPPNPRARREALRHLAADPAARPLLTRTLEDPSEDVQVRFVCALALQSQDPNALRPVVERIVLEESGNDEFKAALLTAITHAPGDLRRRDDFAFREQLRAVVERSGSRALRKAASKF